MILMIVLGLFMTLLGVLLGGTVLELTVRAMAHSLAERPVEGLNTTKAGSRWPAEA